MTSVRLTPAQERALRALGRHPHMWRKPNRYQIEPDLFNTWNGAKVHDSTVGGLVYRGLLGRPPRTSYADDTCAEVAELTPAGRQWLADHPEES